MLTKKSWFNRDLLLKPDGNPYVEGELIRDPKLAGTLTRIAHGGPEVFYNGSVALDILLDLDSIGEDLSRKYFIL